MKHHTYSLHTYSLKTLAIIFITACLLFPAQNSWSQEMQEQTPSVIKQDKTDKIPDEYIDESMAYYDECAADYNMTQYYDCQCLSLAFLDKRIEQGPIPVKSSILLSIRDQCRDAVGAAGVVYQSCLRKANSFRAGTDPEKYCECVANTYTETIDRAAPIIGSRTIVRFKTDAYIRCNKRR